MSIDPGRNSSGHNIRLVISGCLGILALCCIICMAFNWPSSKGGEAGLQLALGMLVFFSLLDVLAIIGIGVWVLRPPVPNAVGFLGRWAGKILLFLGLSLATVIFLFATCYGILSL
jgi:hypothetical protein